MDQVDALRSVSHYIYLTSFQFRRLLGIYKDDVPRAELFIVFFFRIVDIWNEKIFRVRFEDPAELTRLQERLGYILFFPYVQPEQSPIKYDFANYDERVAANNYITLR